jgi:hypothetical protein
MEKQNLVSQEILVSMTSFSQLNEPTALSCWSCLFTLFTVAVQYKLHRCKQL